MAGRESYPCARPEPGAAVAGPAPHANPPPETHVERLILALRTDFGCLVIVVAFLVIMISAIVFADVITPPASNPFV